MTGRVKITIYVTPDTKAYLQRRYGRRLAHIIRAMLEVDCQQPEGAFQLGKPGEYDRTVEQRQVLGARLKAIHEAARKSEETSK